MKENLLRVLIINVRRWRQFVVPLGFRVRLLCGLETPRCNCNLVPDWSAYPTPLATNSHSSL